MPRLPAIAALALAFSLIGCDRAPPPPAPPSAAAIEAEMQKLAAAEAADQPEAALIYAQEIIAKFPESDAARAVAARLPTLQQAADVRREADRLAALWTYHSVPAGGGTQVTAYIFGESADPGAPALRLVLRRHPEWGRNSYLLLGDDAVFACTGTCTLSLAFDDEPMREVEASRAEDADPPAVFIEDDRMMFDTIAQAGTLRLRVPLQDGRTIDYMFALAGYRPERMQPAGDTGSSDRASP